MRMNMKEVLCGRYCYCTEKN